MIVVKREVIEAAYRLLSQDAYPGLKLAGEEAIAQQFHDDVEVLAEFVAEIVTHVEVRA